MSTAPDPLVEEFLAYLSAERGRSANTLKAYRRDLEALASWLGPQRRLASLRPGELDRFVADRLAQGAAPATVARQASAARGLFRFATEEGLVPSDPVLDAPAVKVPSRLPKALPEEVVLELIEGVDGDDALSRRDRAMLELLYGTGARVGELVGLNLGDLSRSEGLLRVRGKGNRERLVPVGTAATEALSRWLEAPGRPALAPDRFARRMDADALFLNQRGRRISRQGVARVVQQRAIRAGISGPVSPHVLRHSCASHMLAHGADVRVVQELLGHASIGTTQIYTKVTGAHLQQAYLSAHPRASRDAGVT